ncbi:ArsR family transcriptional regulator [Imbroritus primus]|uniref:ArsR family transcriptional regulator n=1 Tax=Imbroritus primus TaxID=3058603 RepID=A0ACD3STZ2_9BURK|nr:ArsR family transcriptional regulator [Burkholderiaceae bacterium PBA]
MARAKHSISVPRPSQRDRERDLGAGVVKPPRRVFEIIEFFEQLNEPATVSDIVQATGIPQSSTSMLLQTLERMGYLCWNPDDRTYMPSLRLHMLGGWVHDITLPRSNLRLAMQELSKRTGLSVVLGQRTGRYVQYAHVVFASNERDDDVPIGVVRPLVGTGLGYSLLAAMPDEEVRRLAIASLAMQEQPPFIHSVEQIMTMVAQARRAGYVYSTRLQNRNKASFSFNLGMAGTAWHDERPEGSRESSRESSLLSIAIAGKRRIVQDRLPDIIAAVHAVTQECLPDVRIDIDPHRPIEPI